MTPLVNHVTCTELTLVSVRATVSLRAGEREDGMAKATSRVVGVMVMVLALGLLVGCSEVGQITDEVLQELEATETTTAQQPSGSGPSTATGAPAPPTADEARQQLDALAVAPAGSMAGYSRDLFPHWASDGTVFGWDEPDGSCDVRDDALIRDGQNVQIDEDCSFTAGSWIGPYTGETLTDSSDVDIDHVVPLANAWRSGASTWSTADREAYANDPQVLLSTEDNANQEKGDRGPEAWKPPNAAYHCEYSRRWVNAKSTWRITITEAEKAALQEMLSTCEAGS